MKFRNREALQIENDDLRVTVLLGGGHIAEILHKSSGINPLWIPPWSSIEPADYDPAVHSEYGLNNESKLLSGIMGHSLCLDIFGPPTPEESEMGISAHGEGSVARYDGKVVDNKLHLTAVLSWSNLRITRVITLHDGGVIRISERLDNLSSTERTIGWTQHVTLGPPFLEPDKTQSCIRPERSRVFESAGFDSGALVRGADFEWPDAPLVSESNTDLRFFARNSRSASFTTHLIDRTLDKGFFAVYSPTTHLEFGYEWDRRDFPWLGIWEENKSRMMAPWRGNTVALGMEFGVSPFPETRNQMVKRGVLFEVPTFRRLSAREQINVDYLAFIRKTDAAPNQLRYFNSEGSCSAT